MNSRIVARWRAGRRLTVLTVLLSAVAALALAAVVWSAPLLLHPSLSASDLRGVPPADRIQLRQEQSRLQEDARLHVLQALGGLLLLAGAAATWRQVQVSREGQLTDRFTSAIEHLGSDKLDVRIGGVHALERIAVNSADDRLTIMEILTAFVRGHSPWEAGSPVHPDPHPTPTVETDRPWLRDSGKADVQVAMTVLGRQRTGPDDIELELSQVDLRLAYLREAQLSGVRIRRSNLAGTWMRKVRLERGDLKETDLRTAMLVEANLNGANLERAYLDRARMQRAQLRSARLPEASLRGADLRAADLAGADLTRADLRGADLSETRLDGAVLHGCRHDARTRWPEGYDPSRLAAEGALPAGTQDADETPAGTSAADAAPAGTPDAAPAEDAVPPVSA